MKPPSLYSLECFEHGWLFCAPPTQKGLPINALGDSMKLFPKNAVIDGGIASSYNRRGYHVHALMAAGTPKGLEAWRKEIEAGLAGRPAEERWWCGPHTGMSSTAIFYVLASDDRWKRAASEDGKKGEFPRDSADFGRCKRLIDSIPEWKDRLPEVGAAFPHTPWPAVVARWDELAAASAMRQTEILRSF